MQRLGMAERIYLGGATQAIGIEDLAQMGGWLAGWLAVWAGRRYPGPHACQPEAPAVLPEHLHRTLEQALAAAAPSPRALSGCLPSCCARCAAVQRPSEQR